MTTGILQAVSRSRDWQQLKSLFAALCPTRRQKADVVRAMPRCQAAGFLVRLWVARYRAASLFALPAIRPASLPLLKDVHDDANCVPRLVGVVVCCVSDDGYGHRGEWK